MPSKRTPKTEQPIEPVDDELRKAPEDVEPVKAVEDPEIQPEPTLPEPEPIPTGEITPEDEMCLAFDWLALQRAHMTWGDPRKMSTAERRQRFAELIELVRPTLPADSHELQAARQMLSR